MKRLLLYITLPLLLAGAAASAQETVSPLDSIELGNLFRLKANGTLSGGGDLFAKSPEVDIANALYGQFSGLLVKNSSSVYDSNQSRLKPALRLHGHSPLLLVDGFPRSLDDLDGLEIEKVEVLKDAAASALYGVKGGDGIVSITTKRGKDAKLQVTAKYQYGYQTMFRAPEFADAYTYGFLVNEARTLDGLPLKYNDAELFALYSGQYPYAYPNVDWWSEVYRDHGDNHQAQFTFTGGNRNFRYFAAVEYLKENFLYKRGNVDDRYNANHYDNRLGIRANVDVNITPTTAMKIGVKARLAEFNKGNYSGRLESTLYTLPSAAFPVKQADGTYGGSSLYGSANPVAQMREMGQKQYSQTKVLADILLRQDLSGVLEGLSADAAVAFDYIGRLSEDATKEFRYSELVSTVAADGDRNYILSEQLYYGTDSKTVEHSHWFSSLQMKMELQGRLNWERDLDAHHVEAHAAYRQRSWILSGQNNSSKTQEILGSVSYNWKKRLFADMVVNRSGSAYMPKGKRFHWYPGVSLAAVVLPGDPYLKVYGSAGLSGSDGDLEHELWRQNYVSGNSYYFGANGGTSFSGRTEGDMAAVTLAPELSRKATAGVDTGGRLAGEFGGEGHGGHVAFRAAAEAGPSVRAEVVAVAAHVILAPQLMLQVTVGAAETGRAVHLQVRVAGKDDGGQAHARIPVEALPLGHVGGTGTVHDHIGEEALFPVVAHRAQDFLGLGGVVLAAEDPGALPVGGMRLHVVGVQVAFPVQAALKFHFHLQAAEPVAVLHGLGIRSVVQLFG